MKRLFYLAAAILGVNGILHLVKLVTSGVDFAAIIPAAATALLGIAYLVIAFLLLRRRDSATLAGVIVPLIGLMITLLGMQNRPDEMTIAWIILDILAIALCGYMVLAGRGTLKRVH